MSSPLMHGESPKAPNPKRWVALSMLALVQFIIYADATIVNVALPSIQGDLGFSSSTLVWVVNCYLLAAGGLLLLGGRLGDHFGHRRMFLLGAGGFVVASLVAGFAPNSETLLVGRVLQGVSEGLAAPAGLALVALLFTDRNERGKAFGIWSGLSGLGAAAGTLLSGVFTDLLTWRLIFFINVPLALIAVIAVPRLVSESRQRSSRERLDWPGAVLVTGGLFALLYAVLNVTEQGWASANVLIPLLIGVAGLVGFVVVGTRVKNPLVPLRFVANRVRATAYAVGSVLGGATAALFFIVVLYMQDVLGYTPIQSGLAWLPYIAAFVAGIMLSVQIAPRWGTRWIIIGGLAPVFIGLVLLCFIRVDGVFVLDVLPATALIGFGIGFANPAVQQSAMSGVSERDAGLGSGIFTTLLQLSGAVGLTILMSVALATSNQAKASGVTSVAAQSVAGYHVTFGVAAATFACALVATFALLSRSASVSDASREDTLATDSYDSQNSDR